MRSSACGTPSYKQEKTLVTWERIQKSWICSLLSSFFLSLKTISFWNYLAFNLKKVQSTGKNRIPNISHVDHRDEISSIQSTSMNKNRKESQISNQSKNIGCFFSWKLSMKFSAGAKYLLDICFPIRSSLNSLAEKKILILDLDETLVHSSCKLSNQFLKTTDRNRNFFRRINRSFTDYNNSTRNRIGTRSSTRYESSNINNEIYQKGIVLNGNNVKFSTDYDLVVEVMLDQTSCKFYVRKRPFLDFFLCKVFEWFEVVIFTASLKQYADPVIDFLDPSRMVKRRYFREECILSRNGSYVKDLSKYFPDLSRVIIIDNSPLAYSLHKENAIPISDWMGNNPFDEALLELLPFLNALRMTRDVRSILSLKEM